jgi:hypothetical protein
VKNLTPRNNTVIKRRIWIVNEIDATSEITKNRISKEVKFDEIVEEDGTENEESDEVVTNRDES